MFVSPAKVYEESARRRCVEIAEELLQEIQHQAPVSKPGTDKHEGHLPGTLRRGYDVIVVDDGANIVQPVRYWQFVEFGTSVMRKQPHVRPAVEVVRKRHVR